MSKGLNSIIIGCDHGGFELKEMLKGELEKRGLTVKDAGAFSVDSEDDYPMIISRVAGSVSDGTYPRGIVICGSGIGASITANRFKGVRAALCNSVEMAKLSRNNANILAIGARLTPEKTVLEILDTWFSTEFEGGRHERRTAQLDNLESIYNEWK